MFSETRFHHRLHLGEAEIFASEQERRLRDIPPLNTLRVLAKRFDLFSRRLHVRVTAPHLSRTIYKRNQAVKDYTDVRRNVQICRSQ
jgi:hypothetical protein